MIRKIFAVTLLIATCAQAQVLEQRWATRQNDQFDKTPLLQDNFTSISGGHVLAARHHTLAQCVASTGFSFNQIKDTFKARLDTGGSLQHIGDLLKNGVYPEFYIILDIEGAEDTVLGGQQFNPKDLHEHWKPGGKW